MKSRKLFLAVVVGATLLVLLLVFTDWWAVLRGPAPGTAEWYWPYQPRPLLRWLPAVLAAGGVLLLVSRWLARPPERTRSNRLALVGLALGSLLLQLALLYADRPDVAAELIDRTLSVQTSGYYWTAAHIGDLHATLRNYPALMPAFESEHARTHPPGLVAANRLTIALLGRLSGLAEPLAMEVRPLRCTDLWLYEQPAAVAAGLALWAVLPLLSAASAVVPAYLLGRRLFGPDRARLAAAGVAFVPALLIFAPQSDQLFVPLSLFTVWALDVALRRRTARWFLLCGILLSLSSFLTIGNAALLIVLAIYAAFILFPAGERPRPGHALRWLLAFAAGLTLFWLVYWVGWGVPPWTIIETALEQHYTLVTTRRRYDWWLLFNLVDLLTFLGVPLLAGFLGLLVAAWRGRRDRTVGLALALLALLLLLNLSGSTRGETGRLWLFFTPLIALVGMGYLAERFPERPLRVLFLALQLALLLAVGLAWRPHRAVIVVAERPALPELPAGLTPAGVQFGEQLVLQGYDLEGVRTARPETLEITLVWQAERPAQRPYTVFNHLLDEDGALVAQQDGWPVDGRWPPSCWRTAEPVVDHHRLQLPPDLPAGEYQLFTGLYDAQTGERLRTMDGRDSHLLATLTIVP